MHRKVDLIGSKPALKLYAPPSPAIRGGETSKAIRGCRKPIVDLGLKGNQEEAQFSRTTNHGKGGE